jgi:hypothetical protein
MGATSIDPSGAVDGFIDPVVLGCEPEILKWDSGSPFNLLFWAILAPSDGEPQGQEG